VDNSTDRQIKIQEWTCSLYNFYLLCYIFFLFCTSGDHTPGSRSSLILRQTLIHQPARSQASLKGSLV